ncbi:hypothetical protein J31TS4_46860 [Paenibacillus sp. J31TS4]|uniref:CdaR family protein n=1 Tax=Paenibacillus sp. J31TS4 TaxID=2807195 RepID=UPI001B1A2A3D|nr:CdaR family protein [Paenibacillus sp. J31TS4]GIP41406.1 hypothetical protein J31TS4_46860 [Paenibacillus sp. J31TS4]
MDKWLLNNNVVKAVALVIGILLWVVVHMDVPSDSASQSSISRDQTYNNVKVEADFDSSSLTIKSIEPSEVSVILRGKPSSLKKVDPETFKVKADLSQYGPGTYTVYLHTSGLPNDVTAEIVPQSVKVAIEEKQNKQVPVIINTVGTPADGYKAGLPVINPGRVLVTAPLSKLDQIETARADVSVEKANAAVTKQVRLTVYDKNGKVVDGVTVNPQLVEVEIPITSPFKQMPLQVKLNGQPAEGFSVASVKQSADQVTVFGPKDVLDQMDFYDGLQVDLTGLKESKTFTLSVTPKNKVTEVNVKEVKVTVEIVPSAKREFTNIPIEIIGTGTGLSGKLAVPDGGKLNVTLEGAPAQLNLIKTQDVRASVDASNLPAGKYDLPIVLHLPAYIRFASGQPELKASLELVPNGTESSPSPTSTQQAPTPSPSPSESPSPSPSSTPANAPAASDQVSPKPS